VDDPENKRWLPALLFLLGGLGLLAGAVLMLTGPRGLSVGVLLTGLASTAAGLTMFARQTGSQTPSSADVAPTSTASGKSS
jgi:hypothetical protein